MSLFDDARSKVRSLRLSELTKSAINNRLNYYIFPCNFITAINNTDSGLKSANAIRNRFYQWEALLAGNETIFLNGEGATQLTQHDGGDRDCYWESKFDISQASFKRVYLYNENGGTQFGASSWGSFGEFTSVSQEKSIRVQSTEIVDLKMLTQFWLCPQPSQNDDTYDDNMIYRIVAFQNYKDNLGNFTYADITLQSINNELASSGQSIQQKIKFASPGQGYAFPKLTFDEDKKINGFTYNTEVARDMGVRSIQLEVVGNACIVGLEIYGYPLAKINEPNNNIYPARKLLIQDFKLPVQEDFLIVSNSENVPLMINFSLIGTTWFDNGQRRRKEIVGDKQMDYQGVIEVSDKTSLATNEGLRTINDQSLVVSDAFLRTIGNNGSLFVNASHGFYDGQKEDGTDGLGIKNLDLTKMDRKRFSDVINMMSFAVNFINLLPYELNYKVGWSLRDFYLVGGFLNRIVFGFPIFGRQIYQNTSSLYPSYQTLPALINKSVYDFFSSAGFASNLNYKSGTREEVIKLPLDIFQKDESSTLGAIYGNNSTTTSIHFTLTDKAVLHGYSATGATQKNVNASTIMLDQTADGYKYKVSSATYALNNRTEVQYTDNQGSGTYIIVGVGIRMLGDGDIRVNMYKDDLDTLPSGSNVRDSIIYQTIIKSQAGYRNSQIREWLTFVKMNGIEAMASWDNEFSGPQAYPEPKPETNLKTIYGTLANHPNIDSHNQTTETSGPTRGEFAQHEYEIYDFAGDGFTTSQQIRDAMDHFQLSPNSITQYIRLSYTGVGSAPAPQEATNRNTNISVSFSNIGDNIPVLDAEYLQTTERYFGITDYHWGWPTSLLGFYLNGTKLMFVVKSRWQLQSQALSSNGSANVLINISYGGVNGSITPKNITA